MSKYKETFATRYLNAQIDILPHSNKTPEKDYFETSMMRAVLAGDAPINLDHAEQIANHLHVDPKFFVGLVLRDHWPHLYALLSRNDLIFGQPAAEAEETNSGIVTSDSTPTTSDEGSTNELDSYRNYVDLNFKVPPAFHKRFKLEATLRRMSMKDLLEVCFECFLREHGSAIEDLKV